MLLNLDGWRYEPKNIQLKQGKEKQSKWQREQGANKFDL